MNLTNKHLEKIFEEWFPILYPIFKTDYFYKLINYLNILYDNSDNIIFPLKREIFRVFKSVKPKDVKVIILGQSPYSDVGSANGLAFSNDAHKFPLSPSLEKILKAVEKDCYNGFNINEDCTLQNWCDQGVLLLNSALTVEKHKPTSHQKMWEPFIIGVLSMLNAINTKNSGKPPYIYLMWGNYAKTFEKRIDGRHIRLLYEHPAAAVYGERSWECTHFSQVNTLLKANGQEEIKW